jgi:hypothetical protein
MLRASGIALASLSALALAACDSTPTKKDVEKLDAELAGKGAEADPALTSSLADQIMVDPSLANQANADAIRPADEPLNAPIPPEPKGENYAAASKAAVAGSGTSTASAAKGTMTLAQLAQRQASGGPAKANFNGCGLDVDYAMGWSNRLPADLPLYPRARVVEAAGSDAGNCNLRVVTYTSTAAPRALVDYYVATARRAGYSAQATREGDEHIVAGTRGNEAYYVILAQSAAGGTSADFVANNGS